MQIFVNSFNYSYIKKGEAEWLKGRTCTLRIASQDTSSNPVSGRVGIGYFLQQETLFSLLSTGWFQGRI